MTVVLWHAIGCFTSLFLILFSSLILLQFSISIVLLQNSVYPAVFSFRRPPSVSCAVRWVLPSFWQLPVSCAVRRVLPSFWPLPVTCAVRRVLPSFVASQKPLPVYEVMPGQDLNISCTASGSPTPYVQWKKVGSLANVGEEYFIIINIIIIIIKTSSTDPSGKKIVYKLLSHRTRSCVTETRNRHKQTVHGLHDRYSPVNRSNVPVPNSIGKVIPLRTWPARKSLQIGTVYTFILETPTNELWPQLE